MKRFITAFIILIISFVLQTTVFRWISFGGIIPNIIIIITASYGFMYGEKQGLLMGFFGGLLADVFFGSFIGLNAIIYMYIGYLNGKFNKLFYEEDIKLPLILIPTSDLLYGFSYYIIMFLLRGRFDISYYFMKIILPELVYTVVVTLVLYPILLFVFTHITTGKRGGDISFV